jgi:hypothetical protein
MSVISQPVNVEQATLTAGIALAKFIVDVKAALKAGTNIGEVIQVSAAAFNDLLPILAAVPTLKVEASEDLWAEVDTLALTGIAIAKALVS